MQLGAPAPRIDSLLGIGGHQWLFPDVNGSVANPCFTVNVFNGGFFVAVSANEPDDVVNGKGSSEGVIELLNKTGLESWHVDSF